MTPLHPGLVRRAHAVRGFVLACVAVGSVTAALIVAQAWLLARAIGETFATRRPDLLVESLPWLAAVFVARALLSWLNGVLAQRSAAAVKSQLRTEIVAARLRAPTGRDSDTESLVLVLTAGLDALDGYFARYLPQLVLAGIVPVVVGVAVWSADWLSAMIIALTLPLVPLFMILVGRLTEARTRRRWRVQARLAHHFADLVEGLPTLQVFGRARAQAAGLARSEDAHRRATLGTLRIAFLSALVLELVAMLSVALVAVGVGLRVVEGDLGLTVALFVLVLAPEAYLPLRQVGVHYHDAADGIAAADEAFALLDAGEDRRRPGTVAAPDPSTHPIRMTDVVVRHRGAEVDALGPVDLTWAPAEVLAVTGPSGCGKSTLVSALLGLVPLAAGTITVGPVDLADVDPVEWRRRFAVVPQQPRLITGTVATNVSLGLPVTRSAVEHALAQAGAGDLDPDRELRPGDHPLSAGELRRLALARALLRIETSPVRALVLDEPTAGLDAATEAAVLDRLRALGIAVLVVTHRPAVLAAADRIVALAPPSTAAPAALAALVSA